VRWRNDVGLTTTPPAAAVLDVAFHWRSSSLFHSYSPWWRTAGRPGGRAEHCRCSLCRGRSRAMHTAHHNYHDYRAIRHRNLTTQTDIHHRNYSDSSSIHAVQNNCNWSRLANHKVEPSLTTCAMLAVVITEVLQYTTTTLKRQIDMDLSAATDDKRPQCTAGLRITDPIPGPQMSLESITRSRPTKLIFVSLIKLCSIPHSDASAGPRRDNRRHFLRLRQSQRTILHQSIVYMAKTTRSIPASQQHVCFV